MQILIQKYGTPRGRGRVCDLPRNEPPPPMQSGCACRNAAGLAHAGCRVQAALVLERQHGDRCWHSCEICKQEFTGGMAIALALAWSLQVQDSDEDNPVRLAAAHNLASALCDDGKYAEAEQMQRA